MACYWPINGFRGVDGKVVASRSKSPSQAPVIVRCGRCLGCRMDKARDWGTRISHEASLHEENSFLTLTYDDEHLPPNWSVDVRTLQLFFKRLRKSIEPRKIRYYACGEYGDKSLRPHYHVILFGYQFADLQVWRRSKSGYYTYRSNALESLWPFGNSEVGTVTRESGAYVARYCLKKINGDLAESHYQRLDAQTGEIVQVSPEFALMSSRPGIGGDWFAQYESDAFPSDFVIVNGSKVPVPQYYKNKLKGRFDNAGSDPNALYVADDLRPSRVRGKAHVLKHKADSTDERLAVREEIAIRKQSQHIRDNED